MSRAQHYAAELDSMARVAATKGKASAEVLRTMADAYREHGGELDESAQREAFDYTLDLIHEIDAAEEQKRDAAPETVERLNTQLESLMRRGVL